MIPSLLADSVTYDIDRALHYCLLWGLEGIELRAVGGPNDRVPFVNESKIRARLLESEIPVVAVDPAMFVCNVNDRAAVLNDLAQFDETLRFCRRIGCSRVVVSSFREDEDGSAPPGNAAIEDVKAAGDALRRAGEKAEKVGVTLCVLNEVGYLAQTGRVLADLLDAADCGAVQAAWSPAEALRAGENPSKGVHHLESRLSLVRCRNGIASGNGWEPRSIDSGEIDWPEQLQTLADFGFDGPLSLEVEAEPQAKIGLRDSTAIIRWIRAIKRA